MKVHHALICFFLTLQDGDIGLITAQRLHEGTEGGNIIVTCSYKLSGWRRLFCTNECEGKNILIETQQDRNQSGRYIIEYKEGTFPLSSTLIYVTITNLTKSDSGLYRCGLYRTGLRRSYDDVEIRVRDAPLIVKPDWTVSPLSTSVPSASMTTTTTTTTMTMTMTTTTTMTTGTSLTSSSGRFTTSPDVSTTTTQSPAAVLLPVSLILAVMIIALLMALLIFCRRTSKPKDRPVENTEYADVAQAAQINTVYEEVRNENIQSRSPVEVSTVNATAKYRKSSAADTTDVYSLATAPDTGKDKDNSITYSVVNFSNKAVDSTCGASRCSDTVIYSVPQTDASDASSCLYGNITSH